ncbi:hypothetical protein Taro_035437 [Colocasia esculenta]|uniref:Uncharacterized protein n=1 Tax=Colocasia esculenta TaxID=4460 RepID=A0A843WEW8_COLES|nr:hypothetical protein [Colocasia esculenta]
MSTDRTHLSTDDNHLSTTTYGLSTDRDQITESGSEWNRNECSRKASVCNGTTPTRCGVVTKMGEKYKMGCVQSGH